ncbi:MULTISPECIES: hypothetical protein [unclassified Streptomyces]|uniref:hypothetical protein n=1 Tax=unclassified Streptomyces TaxID=2593676 RepID=UPI003819FE6D
MQRPDDPDPSCRRHFTAWRLGGNLLVVGPGPDLFSYGAFEHAVVHVRALAPDAPVPDGEGLYDFTDPS